MIDGARFTARSPIRRRAVSVHRGTDRRGSMNEEMISSETDGDKNYTGAAGANLFYPAHAPIDPPRVFPKLLFTLGSRAPLIIATNTPTNRNLAAALPVSS